MLGIGLYNGEIDRMDIGEIISVNDDSRKLNQDSGSKYQVVKKKVMLPTKTYGLLDYDPSSMEETEVEVLEPIREDGECTTLSNTEPGPVPPAQAAQPPPAEDGPLFAIEADCLAPSRILICPDKSIYKELAEEFPEEVIYVFPDELQAITESGLGKNTIAWLHQVKNQFQGFFLPVGHKAWGMFDPPRPIPQFHIQKTEEANTFRFSRWPNEISDLIEWFAEMKPPKKPFEMHPNQWVINPKKLWHRLRVDIEAGPDGPRARMGGIQDDLRRLKKLFMVEKKTEMSYT